MPFADLQRAWPLEGRARLVREVWAWNFEQEFGALTCAALQPSSGGTGAMLALDTEFPGFLRETPWTKERAATYEALRQNVDQLWPIQIGVAVAGSDGNVRGVWSFNMRFDADIDLHSKESVAFLQIAGIDFPRHRVEGIQAAELGRRLGSSALVGPHAPCWLTFSGQYDLGYLMKLLTIGMPLPVDVSSFDGMVSMYIPRRCDLREMLPCGSLESLGEKLGVKRYGAAHTAGSDALLTLELYLHLVLTRTQEKMWSLSQWHGWGIGGDRMWNSYYGAALGWSPDRLLLSASADWSYLRSVAFGHLQGSAVPWPL
mmetsp:Transcript_103470/g.297244  ORF Transcript_103470/g.297244 Transcript_103470/m.297244 type:complete len:315 (+) Transcript_103470:101-1045(+)